MMLVDLFVSVMKVTVSVAIVQLEVSATLMQVKVAAANMWVEVEFMYKSVKRVIQYFCFPDSPIKGGDILDF